MSGLNTRALITNVILQTPLSVLLGDRTYLTLPIETEHLSIKMVAYDIPTKELGSHYILFQVRVEDLNSICPRMIATLVKEEAGIRCDVNGLMGGMVLGCELSKYISLPEGENMADLRGEMRHWVENDHQVGFKEIEGGHRTGNLKVMEVDHKVFKQKVVVVGDFPEEGRLNLTLSELSGRSNSLFIELMNKDIKLSSRYLRLVPPVALVTTFGLSYEQVAYIRLAMKGGCVSASSYVKYIKTLLCDEYGFTEEEYVGIAIDEDMLSSIIDCRGLVPLGGYVGNWL